MTVDKNQRQPNHISVLLDPLKEFFASRKVVTFLDATLGAGGHSEMMLKNHPEIELLIGIDQDKDALLLAEKRLKQWEDRIMLIHSNFENIDSLLKEKKVQKLDGALFDLGISSMQLDSATRGFSFRFTAPLDMRMNAFSSLTADIIVNTYPEKRLQEIFRDYGQERRYKQAAKAICNARRKKRIATTDDLCKVLFPILSKRRSHHPMTLIFQALRIAVNNELEILPTTLNQVIDRLNDNGTLAVISFHSLEDGIVKRTFKSRKDELNILTKKPLQASFKEKRENPRSRSAKLRVVSKKGGENE